MPPMSISIFWWRERSRLAVLSAQCNMSCNSQSRPGIPNGKINKMVKSFLLLWLFHLATVLSLSAGYYRQDNGRLPLIGNSPMTSVGTPLTGSNIPEALVATSVGPLTANSRPVRRVPYVSDTCGGSVNIPLSFERLLPYKSTHFPSRRDYPMLCVWNFTVQHDGCRRARLTMRVDGRSRLPDVDGCSKGYYTVSPNMRGARICGHVGDVPSFHWYVDAYQPENEVTVVTMKNLGINDGFSEGLSFTLQGECAEEEWSYARTTTVNKENARLNRRWMNRVMEDYLAGEGPRVTVNRVKLPVTSTTTPAPTTTTSRPKLDHPVVSSDNNYSGGIQWLHLKSPSDLHSPKIHQKSAIAIFQPPQVVNETNQPIVSISTISSEFEYPATTTTSVPSESTIEPEEEMSSTWSTTDQSTDPFYLTTTSTPLVMASTTDNDELISTTSSTDDPLTSSTTEITTTLTAESSSSSPLSDVVVASTTTTQQPPISIVHVVTPISGQNLVFNRFQTFQRRFLKFLKIFYLF
ncbi:uncharacterized protein LOC124344005 [Daphnia pulicaria]|uniref:uncharacterized protein LOC124344005 n=1 Tax=Daphnia pulicaria TaxID=35523 RepID=UPI001EEAC496|nr:uncharacterized protein LOC124344005 [Daphnia pulicaria]